MGVNKVVLANGDVLVDMSAATVTPETLGEGATAFNAAGDLITGTMAGGGGTDAEDGIIARTIEGEYVNDRVTSVGAYAFYGCASLTAADVPLATKLDDYAFYNCKSLAAVDIPLVTTIGAYAFYGCASLTAVDAPLAKDVDGSAFYNCTSLAAINIPAATTVGVSAFYNCKSLAAVDIPLVTTIGSYAFYGCASLTAVDAPLATKIQANAFQKCILLTAVDFLRVTSISSNAFNGCTALGTLILRSETMATLSNKSALTDTSIASGTGYIYVPASLVDAYKAATNWVTYADQFRAIEDYPEITGGTAA